MANCRTGYKGAVFYMTKEKRGSEPELKLWDSPGTTKKYTKNRKTGQLDLLWGEEQPLFDDWDNIRFLGGDFQFRQPVHIRDAPLQVLQRFVIGIDQIGRASCRERV